MNLASKLGSAIDRQITTSGRNAHNPVLKLENFVYEEPVPCPVCDRGIIVMPSRLERHTLPLEGLYCMLCGQQYEVASVNHIRKRRKWKC
jgi:hypothetical protein